MLCSWHCYHVKNNQFVDCSIISAYSFLFEKILCSTMIQIENFAWPFKIFLSCKIIPRTLMFFCRFWFTNLMNADILHFFINIIILLYNMDYCHFLISYVGLQKQCNSLICSDNQLNTYCMSHFFKFFCIVNVNLLFQISLLQLPHITLEPYCASMNVVLCQCLLEFLVL